MRERKTEVEKIHQELFKDSTENKYYSLGVAQGMSFIYDLIKTFKERDFTSDQWLEIIKKSVSQEDKVNEYFKRIVSAAEQEDEFLDFMSK